MGGGGSTNKSKSATANTVEKKQEEPQEERQELITEACAGCPDGCEALRSAIRNLEANSAEASDLQMSSLMIEDAGVVKLSQVLAKSAHLQVLNLGVNRLTDVAAEALAGTLATTKLRTLILERNKITDVGIAALAKALPPTLEKFMLGRNVVGVGGAQALASSVGKLHTLGLGFASLSPEGAQALAPIMSKVAVLDVSGNHLRAPGVTFLAKKLEDPACTLETLKLESNGVGDDGAQVLSLALGRNKKLQVLEVRRNSVTDEGAKLFALALEKNATLKHLDLFDNSITDVGASALLAAVRKSKQSGSALNKLDLEINDVSPAVSAQIAAALRGS